MRFERNVYRRDYAYTYTDAECHPHSNASADTDSVPRTDAHAVPVAKPIAKPNTYAVRDQPFIYGTPGFEAVGIRRGYGNLEPTRCAAQRPLQRRPKRCGHRAIEDVTPGA